MDTLDTPWYWYYMADCGRWHRFEVNVSASSSFFNYYDYFLRVTSVLIFTYSLNTSSLVQDDPDNPFMSDFIEECYQRNPKGTVTSSSHCRSKFDFSGVYILQQIKFSFPYEQLVKLHLLCSSAAMLQTDQKTGRVRRIRRHFNIEKR